jgi:hypothetical protein
MGNFFVSLRVAETGQVVSGNDFTFNASPGSFHLTDNDASATYGSFTVANDGSISATTGAAVASGDTIDFDLSKLAAVTISPPITSAGEGESWMMPSVLGGGWPGSATVYLPAGTFQVTPNSIANAVYGAIIVADNGSGSLVVTGTTGAAVATGNTIQFDPNKLAAVTVFASDLTDSAGSPQAVALAGISASFLRTSPDTFYIPACTTQFIPANGGVYGTITVADNGSGTLAVTGTTGAAVSIGNTIHFDLSKLAAVTIYGTDLTTSVGQQELVEASGFTGQIRYAPDTVYIPACTVQLTNSNGNAYGSFTVADNGSGSLAVTGASGAAVATGNTIHFDLTKLAAVTIFGSDLNPLEYLQADGFVLIGKATDDTVYFPPGTVQLVDPLQLFGQLVLGTFTVADNGTGSLAVTATTGEALATDPHTIHFSPPYFLVTNTSDSGPGSLRQAILGVDSYAGPGAVIDFNIPTTDPGYNSTTGAFTIQPLSALPTVTDAVLLDGYSQPGASPNTLTIGDNAVLKIVLDGSLAGAVDGLTISGGNSTVRGLDIGNFASNSGLVLAVNGNNLVSGNFLGTDVTGELAAPNSNGIYAQSAGNTVGGSSPAYRNIISGNNSALANADGPGVGGNIGINISLGGDVIQGNYIGTDKNGTTALPNGNGIDGGGPDTIGGLTSAPGTGAGNLISGNIVFGIVSGNQDVIAGNMIGTNATGLAALGNGAGIQLGGDHSTIGGTAAGSRNIISGNIGLGGGGWDNTSIIVGGNYNLVQGNYVGTDITGTTGLGRERGISITGAYNTIGGLTAASRNIISGTSLAIGIEGDYATSFSNSVLGNYIGTDPSGTIAVPNYGVAVYLLGATHDNTIGGTSAGAGNVIAASSIGVFLNSNGPPANGLVPTNNVIQGNLIGTDKTGTVAFGNGEGIEVEAAPNNIIGGTAPGAANVIAYNSTDSGVYVYSGSGITVRGNSIHDNGHPNGVAGGIYLNSATSANNNQAAPILSSITTSATATTISGTLHSVPSTSFAIDLYANANLDPAGFLEGQTYFGSTTVTTDATGAATFTATVAAAPSGQNLFSATATNLATGDTSQFSPVQVASVTTVSSSANPSLVGQPVTFTAHVSPQLGSGTSTGSVQFVIDGLNSGAPVALAGNSASIRTAALSAGTHTIVAVYSGDATFLASSGSLTEAVNYSSSGFLTPVSLNRAFKQGSAIPIKWRLTDANGNLITDLGAIESLTVTGITAGTPSATLYPGNNSSSGTTVLRNDGSQYIYNWQTKGFGLGKYVITAMLNDGSQTQITATVQLSGAGASALVIDGTSSTSAAGALLAGDLTLYVDNSTGYFTTDELARINDAVAGVEALVSPYGTNIIEVDSSVGTAANLVIDANTTTALGGATAGVLGATTDAGEITIVQSWNWYAGSDATQIGAAQFDFQTVVTHELGHGLGLGHSTNSGSVMYASLATGIARRSLSVADLNIPDTDTASVCGLHAAFNPQTVSAVVAPVAGHGVVPPIAPGPFGYSMPLTLTVMSPLSGNSEYFSPSQVPLGYWDSISRSESLVAGAPTWYGALRVGDPEDSGGLQAAPRRWEESVERVFETIYKKTDKPAPPEEPALETEPERGIALDAAFSRSAEEVDDLAGTWGRRGA